MFADIDHGFCFKPLYHIGVSKNISITFLREKGNGRTMQLVAVIYFRILTDFRDTGDWSVVFRNRPVVCLSFG